MRRQAVYSLADLCRYYWLAPWAMVLRPYRGFDTPRKSVKNHLFP